MRAVLPWTRISKPCKIVFTDYLKFCWIVLGCTIEAMVTGLYSLLLGLFLCCCKAFSFQQHYEVCSSHNTFEKNCASWSEVVSNTTALLKNDTSIHFHQGTYSIDFMVVLKNIHNFSLTGSGLPAPRLLCSGRGSGFKFAEVHGLRISKVEFVNCGIRSSELETRTSPWYASVLILNSSNVEVSGVAVRNGFGYGILGQNIFGKSTVINSVFADMKAGGGFSVRYMDSKRSFLTRHTISFMNSNFTDNSCLDHNYCTGTGISIQLFQNGYTVKVLVDGSRFLNNRATRTAGVSIASLSIQQNYVSIRRSHFHNNTALSGSSGFDYSHELSPIFPNVFARQTAKVVIEIADSRFTQNYGHPLNSPYSKVTSDVIYFAFAFESIPHLISISGCTISGNIGGRSAGLGASVMNLSHESKNLVLEIIYTKFTNNTSTAYMGHMRGIVQLLYMPNVTFENCLFESNHGTALSVESSTVHFRGDNKFTENENYYGGALGLYKNAFVYLETNSETLFKRNRARNSGGAIYTATSESITSSSLCPLQFAGSNNNVRLLFSKNEAKISGNDYFGENLNQCVMGPRSGEKAMVAISQSLSDDILDFSSQPLRICHCNNGFPDCLQYIKDIETYPGKTFMLPLLPIGQLIYKNFTLGVPSAIYTSTEDGRLEKIPPKMHIQGGKRTCTDLKYSIHSSSERETVVITAEEDNIQPLDSLKAYLEFDNHDYSHYQLIQEALRIPIYVNASLLPCPFGFQISPRNICECAPILAKLQVNCSIDTLSFGKEPQSWIGVEFLDIENPTSVANASREILTHHHCPYDYCKYNSTVHLDNVDGQCSGNRTGILCGQCKPGLSIMLGSSNCDECSNVYLALLLPFGLAGVLLIAFLILTDMTVATGAINGLLFYANVVSIHQNSLFPNGSHHGVLFTAIAWLNLDLGMETCFGDGLDAYVYAWLQFAFPFYLWMLAGFIIVGSRYSKAMDRACGRNIVQVLATLFLLSYTKLQRTVISGLSFTFVEGEHTRLAVWLVDGNIRYLKDKHIYLFLFTSLSLITIVLPYTLAILLGPWLHSQTKHKVFAWVNKLKPFYDAYLGPLKRRLRWWVGVLLLARGILLFISAVNVFGNSSVDLIAMNLVCTALVVLLWQKGGVYEKWVLSSLESFFLLNLIFLSSSALYNKSAGGNQALATSISVGSAVVVFIVLLGHHVIKRIQHLVKKPEPVEHPGLVTVATDNTDEGMMDMIDGGRGTCNSISTTVIDRPDQPLLQFNEDVELNSL